MKKSCLQKRAIILWLTVAIYALSAGVAWAESLVLNDKDNGRAITMQVGQKITVDLRHPGSGGYEFLSPEYDKSVLELLKEKRIPFSEPGRMGDFGRMVYEFRALKAGQTALALPIKRPWERESQVYFRVTISVRP